ncbi:hypothetical protein [Paenibacillus sp. NFR01]|uniref:hypothetical protein n=1 Tax=Paenibacillus sp. NFR01 TaxID=1566279 RepID=UPI0008CCDBF2|nr:hypothetical protein [Paenibacillus sp. NFR01]SET45095.1 hypothetical protein SAMN03159358_1718 [Paenibacillus sp. NFR01]
MPNIQDSRSSAVVYQADPTAVQHVHGIRETLHQSCKNYLNHPVKVQDIFGMTHEGMLAGMDATHLYLLVTIDQEAARGFFSPYPGFGPPRPRPPYPYPYPNPGQAILPLVLFNLLTISLL